MKTLLAALAAFALALAGCGAPEDGSPEEPDFGFIHASLLHAGVDGDSTGLNLHLVANDAPVGDPLLDCWTGNAFPNWGDAETSADDPILAVPLGGPDRQQLVYRQPIDGIYRVHLTHDWGTFVGEATITLSFEPGSPAFSATLPVGDALAFDVAWPSRIVTAH